MTHKNRQNQLENGQIAYGPAAKLLTRQGIGAKNGTTVVVEEHAGSLALIRTRLTLALTPVPIVSITTGAGIGGVKLYDFPAKPVKIVAAFGLIDLSIASGQQADFETEVAGDFGLGSVIITDPTAFSTDATDDDICAAVEFLMATSTWIDEDLALLANAGDVNFGSGLDLNLNVFVDAADVDNGVTTSIRASGIIEVLWAPLAI